MLRHRSLLSHGPVLGTLGRLTYGGGLALVLAWLLAPWGAPPPSALLLHADQLWHQHPSLVLLALTGLEASAWLHLIQDGDPVAKTPRLLRLLTRRSRRLSRQRRPRSPGGRR